MAGGEGEGARRRKMERDNVLSHQLRCSTSPFDLQVTINKRCRPESGGEASEQGGRGGGGGRQEGKEGVQGVRVMSIDRVS